MTMSTPLALALVAAALVALPAADAAAQESAMRLDAGLVVGDHRDRFEAVLDLDGDGFMDAFDWWYTDNGYDEIFLSGWLNDGTGRLVEQWTINVAVGDNFGDVESATTGDLNHDGKGDMVLAFKSGIQIWLGDGANPPTLQTTLPGSAFDQEAVHCADFDNDGWDDIAFSDGWVDIWLNQMDGSYVAAQPGGFNTTDTYTAAITIGDVNDDGHLDILNMRLPSLTIWYLQDGVVQSSEGFFVDIGSHEAIHPLVGDVDGDGDNDVAVFNEVTGQMRLLRDTGPGLVMEAPFMGGPATHLFDVDGDGDLDGLCCGGGGTSIPYNTGTSHFAVSLNDGTGHFAPAWKIQGLGAHHLAGAADLDHDGDIDLVGGRCVYYSSGDWSVPPTPLVDLGSLTFFGDGFGGGFVSDCNDDGDMDLAFGLDEVYDNDGTGAFSVRPVLFPDIGDPTRWMGPGWSGDWDGDGDTDLIVTEHNNSGGLGSFRGNHLLLNNGAGVLSDAGVCHDTALNMSPATVTGYWDWPNAFARADVDADGDLDVLGYSFPVGGSTRISLNDGAGSFTTPAADITGRVQWVGDLDGDALPDLVVTNTGLRVSFGLGGGLFGPLVPLGTPVASATTVAVLDIDGNGGMDIVANEDELTTLVAHFNDGAGNFTKDELYFNDTRLTPDLTGRALAVDIDADGDTDLLAGPARYASSCVWIFEKLDGQPGFAPAFLQPAQPTGHLDIDGDGDQDLLTIVPAPAPNYGDEAVIRNRTFTAPADGVVRQYGSGSAGTGGVVPVLGASGPFRLGEQVSLRFKGLPASSLGAVTVSFAASDLPNTPWLGTTGHNWPWIGFYYLFSSPGEGLTNSGDLVISFTVDAATVGFGGLYLQSYWSDPGHPFAISSTAGLFFECE